MGGFLRQRDVLILLILGGTASRVRADAPPAVTGSSVTPASPVVEDVPVSLSLQAVDPDPGAVLEYRWRFGDGSAFTAWDASSTTVHIYADPGQYDVLAQVRDETGLVAALDIGVVVSQSGAPALPADQALFLRSRTGPIAVDPAARRVWVVNPDADTVSVLDADAMTLTLEIPVGKHPAGVAVDALGRAWVACRGSDEVRVVTAAGATVQTIPFPRGSRPMSVLFSPDQSAAFVAEYAAGRVRRFDAGSFAETGVLSVGPTPLAMAVTPDGGTLLAARFISSSSGGRVSAVSLPSFTLLGPIDLPVDNTTVDVENAGRGVPNYVVGLALSPDGSRALYAAKKDNILRGQFRDGKPLTFETSVRTLVGAVDIAGRTEDVSKRMDIDNTCQASSVLVSPTGAQVFVTLEGNDFLSVRDARDGRELARGATGAAPAGTALDPVTGRLFVQDFMGRTVSVLDAGPLLTQGARALPRLAVVTTVGTELLSAQVLQGKRIFYNASDRRMGRFDGYMNCAVCHLDGDHDGQVWDFTDRGEGLRNTITLRGHGGAAQGRVHWTANFDEIQDFEHDIRNAFGGTGFLSDGQFNQGTRNTPLGDPKAGLSPDLDALAAYVTSLSTTDPSPHRNPDGTMTAAGSAGEVVFQRLNCALCHGGAVMTDSPKGLLHDVGTIRTSSGKRLGGLLPGLDTPTLKGLWATAPYLHDGSAATLDDVFTHSGAAEHGAMNTLTAQERSDLTAYLLQLDDTESEPDLPAVVRVTSVTATAAETYRMWVATGAAVTGVDALVNGASAGAMAADPAGGWVKTVTASGRVALQARALRMDGGSSLSAEVWVGTTAVTGMTVEAPAETAPLLLTPGRRDGTNDSITFGPGADEVEIFTLAGVMVHRGADWDGSIDGRPARSGVYLATVKRRDGQVLHRKILVVK